MRPFQRLFATEVSSRIERRRLQRRKRRHACRAPSGQLVVHAEAGDHRVAPGEDTDTGSSHVPRHDLGDVRARL